MRQVWQCNFCVATGTQEEISLHEIDCGLNPANRTCWSCRYGESKKCNDDIWNDCQKKVDKAIRIRIENCEVGCDLWKEK